jgi:hypothetical protein
MNAVFCEEAVTNRKESSDAMMGGKGLVAAT